jgi:hypothetical protein
LSRAQQLSIVKLCQLRSQPKDQTAPGASVAIDGAAATKSIAVNVALRVQQQVVVGKCAIPPGTSEGVQHGLLARKKGDDAEGTENQAAFMESSSQKYLRPVSEKSITLIIPSSGVGAAHSHGYCAHARLANGGQFSGSISK